MAEILTELEGDFADGSEWEPADSNELTLASQRVQDAWEARHDTDGFHTADLLIPIESAIVTWSGAAYSISESTADSTLSISANPAVGFVRFTLGTALLGTSYSPLVVPLPSGTELVHGYEDSAYAKTTTSFQIVMFNNVGAFVDRDFLIHVFGTRR
jgi:hypothetical protein